MNQNDLKIMNECVIDMIIFLLAICFFCVALYVSSQNIYIWLAALYMIFLIFYKALVVANIESKFNEH